MRPRKLFKVVLALLCGALAAFIGGAQNSTQASAGSEKARLQWKEENEFARFESKF